MLTTDKISVGDIVRVIKSHHEIDAEDGIDTTEFVGVVGKVTNINKWGDDKYPYEIEFKDEELQMISENYGTLLWEREQLEFYEIKKPIRSANLQGEKQSSKVYHEPKKVATINKNDLEYIAENFSKALDELKRIDTAVVDLRYRLSVLLSNTNERIKEME